MFFFSSSASEVRFNVGGIIVAPPDIAVKVEINALTYGNNIAGAFNTKKLSITVHPGLN